MFCGFTVRFLIPMCPDAHREDGSAYAWLPVWVHLARARV